ncbi:YtxH domain-containing protein [Jeotgalibacillus sp. S-D1]|uniref:YtxH domain-containing protein n=1 Tax=Jeotgalibacillus sp. S-D1 TaxID=2552189 RepID=UPI00105A95CF|nr:YtxH domain-containing protein [Jeotgalibacillus sp. S-D1]TDL30675.1 YtxH domain-containing protein [Jeotgalibacillus sp. S-D1]
MGSNKFSTGIFLGAILGGAVSLLDRETRTQTFAAARKSGQTISYYSSHTRELVSVAKKKAEQLKATVEQIQDDFEFLTEKIDEVKEMTPQLKNILVETKETFEHSGETYKHALTDDEKNEENRTDLFVERNQPE